MKRINEINNYPQISQIRFRRLLHILLCFYPQLAVPYLLTFYSFYPTPKSRIPFQILSIHISRYHGLQKGFYPLYNIGKPNAFIVANLFQKGLPQLLLFRDVLHLINHKTIFDICLPLSESGH